LVRRGIALYRGAGDRGQRDELIRSARRRDRSVSSIIRRALAAELEKALGIRLRLNDVQPRAPLHPHVPAWPCPVCASDKERYADDPHRRVLSSSTWHKARAAARNRDGNRCQHQGDDCYGQLQVHHLVSVRNGGAPATSRTCSLFAGITTKCSNAKHGSSEQPVFSDIAQIRSAPVFGEEQ
jgi:5-methylcytosine-specific restriction endonuclease McrA